MEGLAGNRAQAPLGMLHREAQSMTQLMPLIMSPVFAEKPWGGNRLAGYGKKVPAGGPFGESWEVADLPTDAVATVDDPRSRVASGEFAGRSLRELIDRFGTDLLGRAAPTPEGDFPLLIKLIDAREHLSVQVHPDRAYTARHPEARLKTESWYVVTANPGAHLYLGLRPGVTTRDVAARGGTAGVVGLLDLVPATAGDFHHLPAGLVHALGAGVMVAEVQTPSDTTFRIYDWEDRYDRPNRAMHAAEAIEAIRPELTSDFVSRPDTVGSRTLPTGDAYWIREHRATGAEVPIDPERDVRVLMVISGTALIGHHEASAGSTVVLPAAVVPDTPVVAGADTVILEIGLG
jgi:mannose-6-phosphate isomerase